MIYNKQGSLHMEARDDGNVFFPKKIPERFEEENVWCVSFIHSNSPNTVR